MCVFMLGDVLALIFLFPFFGSDDARRYALHMARAASGDANPDIDNRQW